MMFGMDAFNYGTIINFDSESVNYGAEQTIPSLKDIYETAIHILKNLQLEILQQACHSLKMMKFKLWGMMEHIRQARIMTLLQEIKL